MALAQRKQEGSGIKAFDSFCQEFGLPKDIFGGPGALATTLLPIKREAGEDMEAMRNGMLRYLYRQMRDDPIRYERTIGPEKVAQVKDAYVALVRGSAPRAESRYAKMDRDELMQEFAAELEIAKSGRGVIANTRADPGIRLQTYEQTLPGAIAKMKGISAELRRRDPKDDAVPSMDMGIAELEGFLKNQKERMAASVSGGRKAEG